MPPEPWTLVELVILGPSVVAAMAPTVAETPPPVTARCWQRSLRSAKQGEDTVLEVAVNVPEPGA